MPTRDVALHTSAPLHPAQVEHLAALGLRVVGRLPGDAYRVRGVSDSDTDDLGALDFVDAATDYEPLDKLDDTLSAMLTGAADKLAVAGDGADPAGRPVTLLVSLDRHLDSAATTADLARLGTVQSATERRVALLTTTERVGDVAALDGVLHAEIEPDPHTQNNVARMLTRIEPVAIGLGLDGAGEIVAVADSGIDTGVATTVLADFRGRVIDIRATVEKQPADGADLNNHGTHVCGSIAGNGANSNGKISGMAPAAKLTVLSMGADNSTGLSVPDDLTTGVFRDAYADGARIHSNSWGSNASLGKYTAFAADVDDFVWDHRDMLVVVAAGNGGSGPSTVSAPGTAKNCLTVGASESVRELPANVSIDPNLQDHDSDPATPKRNVPLSFAMGVQADDAEDIASFSARGPVNEPGDPRTKPDIVAPGTFILSCRSTVSTADTGPDGLSHVSVGNARYADDADGVATHAEAVGRGLPGRRFFGTWNQNTPAAPEGSGPLAEQNYFYDSGTSMATPITSGSLALLRQYLRTQRGVSEPSAALMKALIVNGAAIPAGQSHAPDNTRGFGWLDLQQTVMPEPTAEQRFVDDKDFAVSTGDVQTFEIQAADADHPLRVTLAWTDRPGKGLQNKLYLRVVPPAGGAPIDGDVSAFPNPTNNLQRVHVAEPVAGTYTIEVHGIDVVFGIDPLVGAIRQDFAIAVSNCVGL